MAEHLSENFTLEEMLYSETANAKKIPNKPTAVHKKTLKHTCQYCLEKLRSLLNEKYKEYKGKKVKEVGINVTSGYRSSQLNAAVGGSTTSQHCTGEAADIEATIVYTNGRKEVLPYNELYEDIKGFVKAKKMSVDQCIQERSFDKVKKVWIYWVHISHSAWGSTKDRKQFLKYNNGMYSMDCVLK